MYDTIECAETLKGRYSTVKLFPEQEVVLKIIKLAPLSRKMLQNCRNELERCFSLFGHQNIIGFVSIEAHQNEIRILMPYQSNLRPLSLLVKEEVLKVDQI